MLANLLEQLKEKFKVAWDEFQDSTLYIRISEKYEDLNPVSQKLVLIGTALFIAFAIAASPLMTISDSSEFVDEFETKRELTRELLKSAKEAAQVPNIPQSPTGSNLVSQIQSIAQQSSLLPEQIESVSESVSSSNLIPRDLSSGAARAQFRKLNIRQIVELGFKVNQISQSLKMTKMRIVANQSTTGLFDFFFEVCALKSPQVSMGGDGEDRPRSTFRKKNTEDTEEGSEE